MSHRLIEALVGCKEHWTNDPVKKPTQPTNPTQPYIPCTRCRLGQAVLLAP
jgi:hypothetical protein